MVIHTTDAMKLAWKMYERMGFKRANDLGFTQGAYPFWIQVKIEINRHHNKTYKQYGFHA